MKLAVMQPYIFPYLGYFQLINAVNKFVIYDDVNFIKKGWINRNNILLNAQRDLFTIPLENVSQNRLINETHISREVKWKTKLLKSLELAYKKAPRYSEVSPIILETIVAEHTSISNMATMSIKAVLKYLDVSTEVVSTSSQYGNSMLKGQDRILDICKKEDADHYINLSGGMEIYSRDIFKKNGIALSFIKSLPICYKQFNNEFVSSLSIIDLLMFNPKDEVTFMLNQYELL
ncbi:MAG: WbqC family protein [Ferruginibacter sp.]